MVHGMAVGGAVDCGASDAHTMLFTLTETHNRPPFMAAAPQCCTSLRRAPSSPSRARPAHISSAARATRRAARR
eukprot:7387873-Prymnesium_polylepis.1